MGVFEVGGGEEEEGGGVECGKGNERRGKEPDLATSSLLSFPRRSAGLVGGYGEGEGG